MTLEEALIDWFGVASIALGASRVGVAVPIEARVEGATFAARVLAEGDRAAARAQIDRLALEIRGEMAGGELEPRQAAGQLAALGRILVVCPPDGEELAAVLAAADLLEDDGGARLARGVMRRAGLAGLLDREKLDPVAAERLLGRLLQSLIDATDYLPGLAPLLRSLVRAEATPAAAPASGGPEHGPPPAPTLPSAAATAVQASPPTPSPAMAPAPPAPGAAQPPRPSPPATAAIARLVEQMAREEGRSPRILAGLLKAFAPRSVAPDRLPGLLSDKARAIEDLARRLAQRAAGPDQTVQRMKDEAVAALGDGDLEGALSLLATVEAKLLAEASGGGGQGTEGSRRLAAELRAARALVEEARLAYDAAASHYAAAEQTLPGGDLDLRWSFMLRQGAALQSEAEEMATPGALERAVAVYGKALELKPADRAPQHWAITHNSLGNALLSLGDRQGNVELLDLAARSYNAAAGVMTREQAPREWGLVRSNLGLARLKAGELGGGIGHYREAVEALTDALEVLSPETQRADRTSSESNLGTALSRLATSEGDLATFRRAHDAFAAALSGTPRSASPIQWARLQSNIGNVCSEIGERSGDPRWLERAVAAYTAALEEWTEARAPLQWALTVANKGNAQWVLAGLVQSGALAAEAEGSIRRALDTFEALGEPGYAEAAAETLALMTQEAGRGSLPMAAGAVLPAAG